MRRENARHIVTTRDGEDFFSDLIHLKGFEENSEREEIVNYTAIGNVTLAVTVFAGASMLIL